MWRNYKIDQKRVYIITELFSPWKNYGMYKRSCNIAKEVSIKNPRCSKLVTLRDKQIIPKGYMHCEFYKYVFQCSITKLSTEGEASAWLIEPALLRAQYVSARRETLPRNYNTMVRTRLKYIGCEFAET